MKKEKSKWHMTPVHYALCIIGSFLIAVLSFFGVIFADDIAGRVIVGLIWVVVGIGWVVEYYKRYGKKSKKMKKILKITVIILILVFLLMIALKTLTQEDDWICVNGKWERHGWPYAEKPPEPCEENFMQKVFGEVGR